MKKFVWGSFLFVLILGALNAPAVLALDCDTSNNAQISILPATKKDVAACRTLMEQFDIEKDQAAAMKTCRNDILGCGIKTGNIFLVMVPYYVTSVSNFILSLVALVSVLFVVVGGYRYILGGLTDEKEKGKNTIKHALMGLGVAMLAWIAVNVVIAALTG